VRILENTSMSGRSAMVLEGVIRDREMSY